MGTTTPGATLDVNGAINARASINGTDLITITDPTGTNGFLRFTTAGSSNFIQSGLTGASDSKADLIFTSIYGGSEWMRINSNGNVGIGINPPVYKLDVNGSMRAPNQRGTIVTFTVNSLGNTAIIPNIATNLTYGNGSGVWQVAVTCTNSGNGGAYCLLIVNTNIYYSVTNAVNNIQGGATLTTAGYGLFLNVTSSASYGTYSASITNLSAQGL